MKYETFYKAKDIIYYISNLDFAKEQADSSQEKLIDIQCLYSIFETIHMNDKNMYKSILMDISSRLEERLVELNIELEAI